MQARFYLAGTHRAPPIAIEEFDFDAEVSCSLAPIAAELAIFQNQDLVTPR
jgi:hypothetical protein